MNGGTIIAQNDSIHLARGTKKILQIVEKTTVWYQKKRESLENTIVHNFITVDCYFVRIVPPNNKYRIKHQTLEFIR